MTTYYALPTLTTWNTSSTGWSASSGGAQIASGYPGANTGDVVIFDSNSGVARAIDVTVNISASSVQCTGANMTLNSSTGSSLYLYGSTLDLSGFASIQPVFLYNNTGTTALKGGACLIPSLSITSGSSAQLLLTGDLRCNGNIVLNSAGMNANGYNVTCNQVTDGNAGTTVNTLSFGPGTWTFTNVSPTLQCVSLSFLAWANYSTTTFKINTSLGCYFDTTNLTSGNNTLWIVNGGSTGTQLSGGPNLATLRIDAGKVIFAQQTRYTATNWKIAGSAGNRITITNTASKTVIYQSRFYTLTPGNMYLDYCTIDSISIDAGTFVARSSTDNGANTGIMFYKLRPNFLSYF